MRDWELAGLSFGKWCVLLFWLISGGLITGLFVYSCVDSLESIGESTKSSPAYWKAVVAVIVCVLILVGVTVLLIKEGRKSESAMVVECVIFVALFAVVSAIVASEIDREAFIIRMDNRKKPSKIQEHNTAVLDLSDIYPVE